MAASTLTPAEQLTLTLSARYEAQLLSRATESTEPVPAVVVTGFLGSGKTTLVSHIVRNRGALRLAILINEVGAIDIDSQLVDVQHVHAATLPAHTPGHSQLHSLAGGCVCCTAAGGLDASLAALRSTAATNTLSGPLDYLVVETSGVADAEPLAALLSAHGFRLESVITVVDAEAGLAALQHPVAQAQVRCADVVVVNKCDLAGLGPTADVEDAVQAWAPGVRCVRARYGQVPLPTLLDVEPVTDDRCCGYNGTKPSSGQSGAHAAPPGGHTTAHTTAQRQSVQGEIGYLSHEPLLTATAPQYKAADRRKRVASVVQRGTSAPQGPNAAELPNTTPTTTTPSTAHTQSAHGHHNADVAHHHADVAHVHTPRDNPADASQHRHAHLHAGFHTVALTWHAPVSWRAFQQHVTSLTLSPGLLRAKGFLWLAEIPSRRCTFHFSGRQRVECTQGEAWSSQPHTQLVLIGTDLAALEGLRAAFEALVSQPPQVLGREVADAMVRQLVASLTAVHPQLEVTVDMCVPLHHKLAPQHRQCCEGGAAGAGGTHCATTAEGVQGAGEGDSGDASGRQAVPVVVLQVRGDPLHGVRGTQVCGSLARVLNSAVQRTGHLLVSEPEPPAIHAVSGESTHGLGERVVRLLVLPDPSSAVLQHAPHPTAGNVPTIASRGEPLSSAHAALVQTSALTGLPKGEGEGEEGQGLNSDAQRAARMGGVLGQIWGALAAPVLRRAFPNLGCRCDVVGVVAGMQP